jgi:hypothetical protein
MTLKVFSTNREGENLEILYLLTRICTKYHSYLVDCSKKTVDFSFQNQTETLLQNESGKNNGCRPYESRPIPPCKRQGREEV